MWMANTPLILGVAVGILLVGAVGWWFFGRGSSQPASLPASAQSRPANPNPASAVDGGAAELRSRLAALEERVAAMEARWGQGSEGLPDPLTRIAKLEEQLRVLEARTAGSRSGRIGTINELRVPAMQSNDGPMVTPEIQVGRSPWRASCRIIRRVSEPSEVVVEVFSSQNRDQPIARLTGNSSQEIRGEPGGYFFRIKAVGADVVVAWDTP